MIEQYSMGEQAGQLVLANQIANDLTGVIHAVTNQDMKAFWVTMESVVATIVAAGVDREVLLAGLMAKIVPAELIEELNEQHFSTHRAI